MAEPRLKRINTIALRFTKGERDREAAKYILRDVFKLAPSDIYCFGYEGKYSVHVKFSSKRIYDFICSKHDGEYMELDRTTTVKVEDISTYAIKVELGQVPSEITNVQLTRMLEYYGTVKNIVWHQNKDDFLETSWSMQRTAYLQEIRKEIPSTLYLKLTNTYIYISYKDQTPTCNRCGKEAHSAKECPHADRKNRENYKRPENRDNVFDYDKHFPKLGAQRRSTSMTSVIPNRGNDPISDQHANAHGRTPPTDTHRRTTPASEPLADPHGGTPSASIVNQNHEIEPTSESLTDSHGENTIEPTESEGKIMPENNIVHDSNQSTETATLENILNAAISNNDTTNTETNTEQITQETTRKDPTTNTLPSTINDDLDNADVKSTTTTGNKVSSIGKFLKSVRKNTSAKDEHKVKPAVEYSSNARAVVSNI